MIELIGKFHPLVLHMPIGFLVSVSIFEGLQIILKKDFKQAIKHLYIYSAIGFTLTSLLGLALISGGSYEGDLVDKHKWFSLALSAVVIMGAFLNFKGLIKPARISLGISMILMTLAGHYGGTMTHGELFPQEVVIDHSKNVETDFFTVKVLPILEAKCIRCHGEEKQKGKYRLDSVDSLLKAGSSEEKPIVPGDPGKSNFIRLILLPESHEDVMPPEGKARLSDEEIMTIVQWVKEQT